MSVYFYVFIRRSIKTIILQYLKKYLSFKDVYVTRMYHNKNALEILKKSLVFRQFHGFKLCVSSPKFLSEINKYVVLTTDFLNNTYFI